MTKTCSKCKETKPVAGFGKDKYRADGLSCACKACRKKENLKYKKSGGHKRNINQDHKQWFKCSTCIAAIGLGHKKAAKILVNLSPGQIYQAWQRGGISVKTPECGSWRLYASRAAKGLPTDRTQNEAEIAYQRGRMTDIKEACKKGFTWSYIWQKEKASRHTSAKYHAMTQEEKIKHNKRCVKRQKAKLASDPEAKAASLEYQKKWREKNKDRCNEYVKKSIAKRKTNDPCYKVLCNLRNRFKDLMGSTKKGGTVRHSKLIGCSTKQLAHHLESKFDKHMTWDNYGTYWHVDHYLPLSAANTKPEMLVLNHHRNLQPLKAKDNLAKSNSYCPNELAAYFAKYL